ncbi:MAG: DEAD/DEAH box helicase [Candidatus Thorarchaeota archaeon]|jgi:DNA-binding PadR family transcriptional regulator
MSARRKEDEDLSKLREQLKALSNRHAMEILQVLSPQTGEIVPTLGWDGIVEGMLALEGVTKPDVAASTEKSQDQAEFDRLRQSLMSGGTIYETMNKLVRSGFVTSTGDKGRKQRGFMITHEGRLALAAIGRLSGPIGTGTDVQRAAKILLKHKNFVSLLPAQKKFISEIGDVDGNLVIQMPPGSGKTFLAMIVILLRLQKGIRCLYLSPYTSLSRQIVDEYGTLFEELGYSVVRHDGLSRATDAELESGDLVIAMYESFTTALLQKKKWTEKLGLSVIDELTELDSVMAVTPESLGADRSTKLDTVVTLLKQMCQVVTLSSRFGETEEVTEWLDAQVFRPDVRLVPDEFIVSKVDAQFEIVSRDGTQRASSSQEDILDVVIDHLGDYENKSILIVASSRYRAQGVARRLAKTHPRTVDQDLVDRVVGSGEALPLSSRLANTLEHGVAFHHSGLDSGVRERLEHEIRKKNVRTVVSTTGITSGISFPFYCVMILFDRNMYYLQARSRYLQVAGRIGEYSLAQQGGRVYLGFEVPIGDMTDKLLHRPIESLKPGVLTPNLAISILTRDTVKGRVFIRENLEKKFLDFVGSSLRGSVDSEYTSGMKRFFSSLFTWLVKKKIFEKVEKGHKLSKDARSAILADIEVIDFVQVCGPLSKLKEDADESNLIALLLESRMAQTMRPRSFVPSKMELDVMNLDPPEEWYLQRVPERQDVKTAVLERWVDEQDVSTIVKEAAEMARGISLDEGDLNSLLGICSRSADNLGQFLASIKRKKLSNRMIVLSRQLMYGVREDLAATDLLELQLLPGDASPSSRLSREKARILFEHGYESISDVVKKDLGASKEGYARDRFAKNSGLDSDFAKEVYKAALSHVRAKLDDDDD